MVLCSMGLFALAEALLFFQIYRPGSPLPAYLSASSLLTIGIRGPVLLAAFLVLRPPSDPALFSARQTLVLRILLVTIACYLISLTLQLLGLALGGDRGFERTPFAWRTAITVLLLFINSILVSLAFRNPGYNSASPLHPSDGAGRSP